MRCPSCCKFVSLDFSDPEVEEKAEITEVEISDDTVTVTIAATVRIERTCAECGDAMKESTLELDTSCSFDAADHVEETKDGERQLRDGCGFEIEAADPEQIEEGGHRYKKSYYGASIACAITCACGEGGTLSEPELSDKVQASAMDEVA